MSEPDILLPEQASCLSPAERGWMLMYDTLLVKGYRLRARYHPDWKPSWVQCGIPIEDVLTDKLAGQFEDCLPILGNGLAVDATRVSDGKTVWLKVVHRDSQELSILQTLSSDAHRNDPRNHCVKILDVFWLPVQKEEFRVVVMPILRNWHDPEMHIVEEAMLFIDQLLEGIAFFHELNITHGDIRYSNVMIHADAMYPNGYNPLVVGRDLRQCSVKDEAPRGSRLDADVKYTYIDFGFGYMFDSFDDRRKVLWEGGDGLLPEIQGFQDDSSGDEAWYHDPFAGDIWSLGCLILDYFCRPNFNLMPLLVESLVPRMIQKDPAKRPSADQCLKIFRTASSSLSWSLCYRLPTLSLIVYDASKECRDAERREGGRDYIERMIRFLAMTGGRPRLLK